MDVKQGFWMLLVIERRGRKKKNEKQKVVLCHRCSIIICWCSSRVLTCLSDSSGRLWPTVGDSDQIQTLKLLKTFGNCACRNWLWSEDLCWWTKSTSDHIVKRLAIHLQYEYETCLLQPWCVPVLHTGHRLQTDGHVINWCKLYTYSILFPQLSHANSLLVKWTKSETPKSNLNPILKETI